MSNSAKELVRLITENPELPVVPMVDSDIVDDDCCGRYKGSFGKCSVGEYAVYRERIYFDKEDFKKPITIIIAMGFAKNSITIQE